MSAQLAKAAQALQSATIRAWVPVFAHAMSWLRRQSYVSGKKFASSEGNVLTLVQERVAIRPDIPRNGKKHVLFIRTCLWAR